MTPEQERIVKLEKEVADLQKTLRAHVKMTETLSKVVTKLANGAGKLERMVQQVEIIARRGVNMATTNTNGLATLSRKITSRNK